MARALVVEDEPNAREALAEMIEIEGFVARSTETLAVAREIIDSWRPEIVLCDLILPDGQGTELLVEQQERAYSTKILLITGNATVDSAVEALRLGAFDYLTKPVDIGRLKTLLRGLLRSLELEREVNDLRGELRRLGRFGPMVGTSQAMQEVYDLIERVAPTDATVFLTGESGSGKELAAQAVHQLSRRKNADFLAVNCGAISPNLIESELFGHERGSFTGANRQHPGYFERASGSTLFLDEITEMPIELQVKLLRVLETSRVLRIGATSELEVDVRVIAATNRDPEQAVADERLREDLYYRLQVFPIRLPNLAERAGDVEHLTVLFVSELNQQHGKQVRVGSEVIERLTEHFWPGNVRELKNVVERAYILADREITLACLPRDFMARDLVVGGGPPEPMVRVPVGATLEEAERKVILATLGELGGNRKATAKMLGISIKTLYNRLQSYQQQDERSRPGSLD